MRKPCFAGGNCHNVGNGSFECDSCPEGYEGDGETCTDIDEVMLLTLSKRKQTMLYDIDLIYALRIKNASERDLRNCKAAKAALQRQLYDLSVQRLLFEGGHPSKY